MKIVHILISLLFCFSFSSEIAFAKNEDDPEASFSTDHNYTKEVIIKWISVKNIQKTCEQESRKRNFGGFGYKVEACSFWDRNKEGKAICSIFTMSKTTMHAIGHEMRHCFQGEWHK